MEIKEIDCRKLDCPEPVLNTKKALENHALDRIRVLVDNDAAIENVSRFLNYQGFEVSVDSDGVSSAVEGVRDKAVKLSQASSAEKKTDKKPETSPKIMVMISSTRMGQGDDELGEKLMINFIKTLKEMGDELWRLVFVNHGVKLATSESAILGEVQDLLASGVDILVCGTCLTHLGLMEKKKVGTTTNMLDIVTSMQYADKVINL